MGDYIIIGDTKDYKDCLIYVCGPYDNAEKVLHRMLTEPDENDKRLMQDHTNLRIKFEPEQDCWWKYGCD